MQNIMTALRPVVALVLGIAPGAAFAQSAPFESTSIGAGKRSTTWVAWEFP